MIFVILIFGNVPDRNQVYEGTGESCPPNFWTWGTCPPKLSDRGDIISFVPPTFVIKSNVIVQISW